MFLTKLIQTKTKTLCSDSLGFVWLEIKYYKSFSYNFVLNFITISREAASLKKSKARRSEPSCASGKTIGFQSWKLIGTVNETLTFCPFCFPGFHCGKDFTTRIASLLILSQSIPRTTSTSFTSPFLSMIN